jgi:hypothetical protein
MVFWVLASMAQIVAWAVILALHGNDPCDSPARAYLILTCVRHGLSIPLSIYTDPATTQQTRFSRATSSEGETPESRFTGA